MGSMIALISYSFMNNGLQAVSMNISPPEYFWEFQALNPATAEFQ